MAVATIELILQNCLQPAQRFIEDSLQQLDPLTNAIIILGLYMMAIIDSLTGGLLIASG